MGRSDLAVVIPCHDEARTLAAVVAEAARHARVFVVDDRSTDGSAGIAAKAGATVLEAAEPGYDGALATGLRHAHAAGFRHAHAAGFRFVATMDADGEHDPKLLRQFRAVATMDADGEHDPKLLRQFRARLAARPLVLGVREKPQRLSEALVGFAARSQFGVSDPLCGMKGYARPVLDAWLASGAPLNINMTPMVLWRARGGAFDEVRVAGTPRRGRPRFGRALSADFAILRAYARALAAAAV